MIPDTTVVKLSKERRWVAIADLIASGARPTTPELAKQFNVSEVTIRRDLRHPYVLRKVKERILLESKPQDMALVMRCIREAIDIGDVVTARWYYDILFSDYNEQKEDVEVRIIRTILGPQAPIVEEDLEGEEYDD